MRGYDVRGEALRLSRLHSCYPAVAANAFAKAFPEVGGQLDLCPTDEPDEHAGWPPLPGDHRVVRYRTSVAVYTLNSTELIESVSKRARAPDGLRLSERCTPRTSASNASFAP